MKKCQGWDHIIDLNDYGSVRCMRCNSQFTELAIKKCLQFRFPDSWEMQWSILRGKKERLREKDRKEERKKARYEDPFYDPTDDDPEDWSNF